MIIIISNSF